MADEKLEHRIGGFNTEGKIWIKDEDTGKCLHDFDANAPRRQEKSMLRTDRL